MCITVYQKLSEIKRKLLKKLTLLKEVKQHHFKRKVEKYVQLTTDCLPAEVAHAK